VRLITYRAAGGGEQLGVADGDRALAATTLVTGGPAAIEDLLRDTDRWLDDLRLAAASGVIVRDGFPVADVELLAPVPRPGKIIAIGRNYADHVTEDGAVPPPSPLIFAKFPSSVVGPGADIVWDPEMTAQVDYEAELAVVIGRRARHVTEQDALDVVLGYTCLNDVSARDLQFGDVQWVRGKSLDTFCPMGPSLVTGDELGNPDDLDIACLVNGEMLQHDRTSSMFYGVRQIISHCSRAFTLEPGDVIATGTPGGVGIFRNPPRLLGDGDVVTVAIEGIGELVNTCRTRSAMEG
jgi:2-keto-4-pentenoate hydratase/2-oxohepta-3-ene-1,7-dioic acid hydratase in catechol pathway